MNQLRVSHKSFFIQNKIFVIGGDYDMSCEVYDIKENKWSFISSYNSLLANSLYSFSSAIAISDWIYYNVFINIIDFDCRNYKQFFDKND